jgi:hypothetical protein
MRVVGLFLSALALALFIVQQGFGRQFLDGAIIEFDKPIEVRGKEMTTFGGGGIRIRWEDKTYALVNVVPPSLKMGCGGIDINLGALGLLNFAQFGKLFEALMGPAGVMFTAQLALSALCPQCAEVLQQLMNLANQLNQMQISKCGAVQLAGTLGEMAGRWIHDNIFEGKINAWNVAFENVVRDVKSQVKALYDQISKYCPNGKCGAALMLKGGCIVDMAVKETMVADFLGMSKRDLAAVVRYYVGDVCFPGRRDVLKRLKDEGTDIRWTFEWDDSVSEWADVGGGYVSVSQETKEASGVPQEPVPYGGMGKPDELIKRIAGLVGKMENGKLTNVSCEGGSYDTLYAFPFPVIQDDGNIKFEYEAFPIPTTICQASMHLVDRVFDAIMYRGRLNDEDKALLSAMPVGVFKLINYGSVYTGFLIGIREDLAYYIAEEAAIGLFQALLLKVSEWVAVYQSGLTQKDGSHPTAAWMQVQEMLKRISTAQMELANYRRYTMDQLRQKIQSYHVANQIYNDMLAQMAKSPVYGNMVFSRLIGLGPVGSR